MEALETILYFIFKGRRGDCNELSNMSSCLSKLCQSLATSRRVTVPSRMWKILTLWRSEDLASKTEGETMLNCTTYRNLASQDVVLISWYQGQADHQQNDLNSVTEASLWRNYPHTAFPIPLMTPIVRQSTKRFSIQL